MIKAILFDFFDVIHRDNQKAWLAANGFKREGGFDEASDLVDSGKIDLQTYYERFAQLSGKTAAAVADEYAALAQLNEPLVELIERLHERYLTGLISNAHTDELQPILERHNLHRLFHEITISSELGVAKPHQDIFLHMTQLLQIQPTECIFTDDNPANVAGATALGMTGIVFESFEQFSAELRKQGISIE